MLGGSIGAAIGCLLPLRRRRKEFCRGRVVFQESFDGVEIDAAPGARFQDCSFRNCSWPDDSLETEFEFDGCTFSDCDTIGLSSWDERGYDYRTRRAAKSICKCTFVNYDRSRYCISVA
jgi:hypothetical protein